MGRLLLLLFCCSLLADDTLRGIVIVDAVQEAEREKAKQGFQWTRETPKPFSGIDLQMPWLDESTIDAILCPYLGQEISNELVQNIKNSMIDFLRQQDILAMIIIPEQEVVEGVLKVEILASEIAHLEFTGQNWFSQGVLERFIRLKKGDLLDQNQLLNDIAFLNLNPARKSTLFFSPGEEVGSTDIEIHTKDEFPCLFYMGADNTGVTFADRARLFAGARWENAFQRGDLLSYQYAASPNLTTFQTHEASYTSYLSSRNVLNVSGTYGQVLANIPDFRNEGISVQATAIYTYLAKPLYRRFKSQFDIGLIYKYIDSNLFFLGTLGELPVTIQSVNLTEFQLSYSLSNFWGPHQISLELDAFVSPQKGLLPHQTDPEYQVLRPDSMVKFAYFLTSFAYRYNFNDYSLVMSGKGQLATGPLISSEQFSLGGMHTVRGYEQAQFLADNAFCSNVEFLFPAFPIVKKWKDQTTTLLFYDVGFGHNYDLGGASQTQLLMGVGPGLRYEVPSYLSICSYYGFRLRPVPGSEHSGIFYLKGTLSF